jgi:hypothetical protein
MHWKSLLLAALLTALAVSVASAQTVLDDPLHGYTIINGTPTNTDNNVVTPIASNPPVDWGFNVSPATASNQTGTLYIDILTPSQDASIASMSLTGTLPGTATLFSSTAWTNSSQTLASYLGLSNSSPPNNTTSWGQPTGSGYYVDQAMFSNVTLTKLSLSTMDESLANSLPAGSLILAFLVQTNSSGQINTIATANSGALYPTPLPGALSMLALPLSMLIVGMRRRKSASRSLVTA